MPEAWLAGLILVCGGGILQGSFMAPAKWIRGWAWENYWLLFAVTAYLIAPWWLAWATVPRLFEIYAGSTPAALISVGIFGVIWGIGALAFGLGVDALGMAIGFAIILGVATTFGTLIPLIAQPPPNFSVQQFSLTLLCLGIMLAGVITCSFAGKWQESGLSRKGQYIRGVIICVASGVFSAFGNLGLTFAGEITKRALALGVPEANAPNAVWTLLTLPLFLCNSGYSLFLLRKNRTGRRFRLSGNAGNYVLALSMGLLWMGGLALYGSGTRKLGAFGTSLGFAIFMSSTVLIASTLGILTGEWRNAPAKARRQMGFGVLLLLIAICSLAAMNQHSHH
jgi:L-rhamnose-H+ transport protein